VFPKKKHLALFPQLVFREYHWILFIRSLFRRSEAKRLRPGLEKCFSAGFSSGDLDGAVDYSSTRLVRIGICPVFMLL